MKHAYQLIQSLIVHPFFKLSLHLFKRKDEKERKEHTAVYNISWLIVSKSEKSYFNLLESD